MKPTTSHRPPGDRPCPAAGTPRGPWLAARLAVVALILWAVVDVLRSIVAVGYYEHRINEAVHGNVDPVLPALMAYELLDHLMPRGKATTVADKSWILGSLVAAAAFITWLYQARRNAGRLGGALTWAPGWAVGGWFIPAASLVIPYLVVRDVRRSGGPLAQPAPVGRWWASLLVTVLLNGLIWLHHTVTSDGGIFEKTALDRRIVIYPLWTVETVMIVVTAFLAARMVRRITQAQQRTAATAGPPARR